ncbi:restriction endonuclease [Agrobacterium rhizogenes]|uniref:type I restriction endonuclease n=1 Tax=Rhizobium TaxID=379 RepID=UPI00026EE280|nr:MULTISPECIES: type I restriction endonuclease [Rhizobium]EJK82232.1 hypothetical protein PMI03_04123 [Rhizobium sp. AP16]NTF87698.1 restriction endonuclease [Rhizobium rhizogenes]
MSFKEEVAELSKRAVSAQNIALTEEATKNALVMPFLRTLGFDVFDPTQIVPEFVADVGLKKGEKVDYAVKINDKIEFILEAKAVSANLSQAQYSQLYRYFSTTDCSIAILTNGIQIWFFTDLDAPNKLDSNPFFKFDLFDYDDNDLKELEKFHKEKFSIDDIKSSASTLKRMKATISCIEAQFNDPDDEFVRLISKEIYDGKLTAGVVAEFKPIIKRAFEDLVRQKIQKRLSAAFNENVNIPTIKDVDSVTQINDDGDGIETTQEEIDGFNIVRAIAAELADVSRIVMRDQKSYCGINFDDNNRKPIVRLHFNSKTKFLTIFDAEKAGSRFDITQTADIFKAKAQIQGVIQSYVANGS